MGEVSIIALEWTTDFKRKNMNIGSHIYNSWPFLMEKLFWI